MPVKKEVSKVKKVSKVEKSTTKVAPKKTASPARAASLTVPVYSLVGKESGTLSLPKEIFGQKVNKKLLSQAVRVYMTNRQVLPGSTKGRGEVTGSTAKIYRQKGTGRARHGAIRAPIFVGGGIVFGPKPRKVRLELPQRMKKAALLSAFSAKMNDKQLMGLSGLEKAAGKTKEMAKLMYQVSDVVYQGKDKKHKKIASTLIITPEKMDNVVRAVSNIPGVDVLPVNLINAYEVVKHGLLLITKEAVDKLSKPQVKEQK